MKLQKKLYTLFQKLCLCGADMNTNDVYEGPIREVLLQGKTYKSLYPISSAS